jgi:hypothetical protein
MLSPERIAKIDAMSEEEMAAHIAQGPRSTFNEESRAQMQARIAQIRVQREQQAAQLQAQRSDRAAEANEIARESNDIQRPSDQHAAQNVRWMKWIAIITLLGVVVAAATYLRS